MLRAMSPPSSPRPWLALPPEEQGFVLGACLFGAGAALAERLAGEPRSRCGAAVAALEGLPRAERVAALAELGRIVGQPPVALLLAGVEHEALAAALDEALHAEPPDLALALLAGLPPPVRARAERHLRAVNGAGLSPLPMDPTARAELQRALLVRLVFDRRHG
jgi:hypothetical protein